MIEFVQQPDALKGVVPIEVEDYDPIPYFLSALPIALAVLGQQTAHEVAHRVVASSKKVEPPLLLFQGATCMAILPWSAVLGP